MWIVGRGDGGVISLLFVGVIEEEEEERLPCWR